MYLAGPSCGNDVWPWNGENFNSEGGFVVLWRSDLSLLDRDYPERF